MILCMEKKPEYLNLQDIEKYDCGELTGWSGLMSRSD